MSPAIVRGRLVGAVLSSLGVLLALPMVFWPVLEISYRPFGAASPADSSFVQLFWVWGKYAEVGNPDTEMTDGASNTTALVFIVTSLVVGLIGAAAWALVPGMAGRSLGLAGSCFVLASQLGSLTLWWGQFVAAGAGSNPGLFISIEPAAWSQLASCGALAVAVGLMVWRPLSVLVGPCLSVLRTRARRRSGTAGLPGAPGADGAAPADLETTTPRVGTAVLQQEPAVGRGTEQGMGPGMGQSRGRSDDGPSVGFSDETRQKGRRSRRSR